MLTGSSLKIAWVVFVALALSWTTGTAGAAGLGFADLNPTAPMTAEAALQAVTESASHPRLSFGLLGSSAPLASVVEQLMHEEGLDPQLSLVSVPPTTKPDGVEAGDFEFSHQGMPLCNARLRAFRRPHASPLVVGNAPLGPVVDIDSQWPSITAASNVALRDLKPSLGMAVRISSQAKCYLKSETRLIAVWQLTVAVGVAKITALADADYTYDIQRRYFAINGTAVTYPRDPFQGDDFESFTLHNLDGATDKLQNSFFSTTYDDLGASGISRASPTDAGSRTYDYSAQVFQSAGGSNPDIAKDHFAEVSAFTNLNRILEFFQGLGFSQPFSQPMPIIMNYGNSPSTPDININNAAYLIDENTGRPKIVVGDGDGYNLKYLPLSFDVVAHEFGHHVIFRALKTTVGTSVIIHEALADFFTMMMTDDSCLAPSICGSVCFIPTCLRTADNNFYVGGQVGSKTWENTQYHLRSQVISGMLWDLYQGGRIPKQDLKQLVYNAIDYLPISSTFAQLIEAMVMADHVGFDSQYGCEIVVAAETRKLIAEGEVSCDGDKSSVVIDKELADAGTDGTDDADGGKKKNSKSSDGPLGLPGCGSIAGVYASGATGLWLLLGLPLILAGCQRRRQFGQRRHPR